MAAPITLNERAQRIADHMASTAEALRIAVGTTARGARVIDCGVKAAGGLQAGLALARVCLAGAADVSLVPGDIAGIACPHVQVATDQPLAACMASQYAGWPISVGKFFAMSSGPMRAVHGNEEIFDDIGLREKAPLAVGVLESRKLPDDAVIDYLAAALEIAAAKITLLVAPAASLAGNLQVIARSVETALHKLHALGFDLKKVVSAFGSAPLPPVAVDELSAIGRTNDAILYGSRVQLWVRCDDDEIISLGPQVPSANSSDHGVPFAQIFERYERDFYKIDRLLFSPAEIVLNNLTTGSAFVFGRCRPDVLLKSFYGV